MNPDSSDLRYIMEKILILDFGSQYTQLIARRVRELSVYCEIHPFNKIPAIDASVRGVILSGSPFSVRDAQAPTPDLSAIKGKLPLLGVCYGAQFLASAFGGEVQPAPSREYGRAMLTVGDASDALMRGLPARTQVWMSHGDTITRVPDNYELIASTEDVRVAAFHVGGEQTWGIQFHPEVYHSTDGMQLLKNFVAGICGCKQEWTSESFVEATVRELREKLGDDKVVLGLSGGVDSSVAAVLLHKAIGKNLYCIFVDSGLLRKNEFEDVLESYKNMGLNVKGVKAGTVTITATSVADSSRSGSVEVTVAEDSEQKPSGGDGDNNGEQTGKPDGNTGGQTSDSDAGADSGNNQKHMPLTGAAVAAVAGVAVLLAGAGLLLKRLRSRS